MKRLLLLSIIFLALFLIPSCGGAKSQTESAQTNTAPSVSIAIPTETVNTNSSPSSPTVINSAPSIEVSQAEPTPYPVLPPTTAPSPLPAKRPQVAEQNKPDLSSIAQLELIEDPGDGHPYIVIDFVSNNAYTGEQFQVHDYNNDGLVDSIVYTNLPPGSRDFPNIVQFWEGPEMFTWYLENLDQDFMDYDPEFYDGKTGYLKVSVGNQSQVEDGKVGIYKDNFLQALFDQTGLILKHQLALTPASGKTQLGKQQQIKAKDEIVRSTINVVQYLSAYRPRLSAQFLNRSKVPPKGTPPIGPTTKDQKRIG